MIKVFSGFPGVGKTYFSKKNELLILDLDSSRFSWIERGIRHPNFPQNYIDHIKESMGKFDIILVSSHKVVREVLVKNNIDFTLVFPERALKGEYLERFRSRGNLLDFIEKLDQFWDLFMDEMESQKDCKHIRLKAGEFLEDIIK